MKSLRPNEADLICNRFEIGHEQPGDTIRLMALKELGVHPVFYQIDMASLVPRRKEMGAIQ